VFFCFPSELQASYAVLKIKKVSKMFTKNNLDRKKKKVEEIPLHFLLNFGL